MKETRLFYTPELSLTDPELSPEESAHAVRVLRMKEGDELTLTDGRGLFHLAEITLAHQKHCRLHILQTIADRKTRQGEVHLAVAPTKNMDRTEWLAEKATEIGIDSLSFLLCDNSERKVVKTERIEKVVVAAMKQSHKAFLPVINELTPFNRFIAQPFEGEKFIAHCYAPSDLTDTEDRQGKPNPDDNETPLHLSRENYLGDLVEEKTASLVLIGPEGDFSIDEVKAAIAAGFRPISLGEARLRTETAAIAAVHLMNIQKRYR